MIVTALRARTALAIGAAGATVITALALTPGRPPESHAVTSSSAILSARLASAKIQAADRDQDIAVTIHAPGRREQARPPLSVAVVIDRSGSMHGVPMQNAKAAAADLVDRLAPEDAFAIISFSSGDETVMPISRATPSNKAAARAAIDRIWDDGGTCISCGLTRGAGELAHSPITGGLRRIVLISDGQANEGISDRTELAELASQTASRGDSISTVGVGLDFDELTMIHLAEVGRGNYYFVEHTANLDAMFANELAGLGDTVAADVKLVITPASTTAIERAYGYPLAHDGRTLVIPIADLRAGELRKVVLPAQIMATGSGALPVARFELTWRDPLDGTAHTAVAELATTVVDDAAAVAASIDRDAVQAIAEARTAQVLDDATTTYEQQGAKAAQQVIEHHLSALRADKNLDPAAMQKIDQAASQAIDGFAAARTCAGDGVKAREEADAHDRVRAVALSTARAHAGFRSDSWTERSRWIITARCGAMSSKPCCGSPSPPDTSSTPRNSWPLSREPERTGLPASRGPSSCSPSTHRRRSRSG